MLSQSQLCVADENTIGVGLAYVVAAKEAGARAVIIADLRLTKEAEAVVNDSKKTVTFEKCDVTKWQDLQNVIDLSLQTLGDVPDIYVASAGVFEPVSCIPILLVQGHY
jgi:NAD(P)-dependent dehydrogenase (short-subunit alcohol dehydrogenase family)